LIERRLAGHLIGDLALLDVVETASTDVRTLTLFFLGRVDASRVVGPYGSKLISEAGIAGASVLRYQLPLSVGSLFHIDDQPLHLVPAEAELDLLAGANATVSVRNGETAETVLDWLAYHITHHGMTAAVILDRAKPQSDRNFTKNLTAGLVERALDCSVVVVTSDIALGEPNMPPEAHPYCVGGAPGKDRMRIPAPSPWDAPLAAMSWYEIARTRFLARARAVASLEVHDLAEPAETSIFDAALSADGGVIRLLGQACYPWRTRGGDKVGFGDHICIQFDAGRDRKRWCIAPRNAPDDVIWKLVRIANGPAAAGHDRMFYRHMALRHPSPKISQIVPKTGLVEHPPLLRQSQDYFGHKPVRIPEMKATKPPKGRGRFAIVTTMKNEGPFILEWLAYHRAVGFDDFLIYTNDCTDGTDTILDLLERKGFVQHRDNDFRKMNLRPQHAALQMAEEEPVVQDAKWVTCIDVDEYVNIKTGNGTLDALFAAVPDANMISMTWRLFGNADIHWFSDTPITQQFTRCAPEFARKPHQAWGFKTLFQNIGIFKKLGVHRPKGLNPQLWENIKWVNGNGALLPKSIYRNGWRSTVRTYGYDLVQLNHYAVRSTESFLVKRDRGRVNHVDRDQGLSYWFRMNNNFEEDHSIQPRLPMMQKQLDALLADPEIAKAHADCVASHRAKIAQLRARPDYKKFFEVLTSSRLGKLAHLHSHFGANVFLSGPDVIPDEIVDKDPLDEWFFTVERPEKGTH
jgi:hypothetical protein